MTETFDLDTPEGRDALAAAERLVRKYHVAPRATFLREVHETGADERVSEAFQRRIWERNPIYSASSTLVAALEPAVTDPEFRRWFVERTGGPLPDDPQERTDWLDACMREVRERAWPNHPGGSTIITTRAFAALFPHDFTAHRSPGRRGRRGRKAGLYVLLGGGHDVENEALVNRWILDRLEQAAGPVDRTDWTAVARRMVLPDALCQVLNDRPPPPPRSKGASPDQAPRPDRSELGRIAAHFDAVRTAGRLIFEPDDVESLHLGLWAHERRHFAVLTGLSGTGKTRLAVEYAKALAGQEDESTGRIRTIAVQPGWHDPAPLLGYVDPLGENRYASTEFLRFLIRASENRSQPHACVLDEMNLSHPEQYLAPILSAMELDDGRIELHGGDENAYGVPPSIPYPGNLVLIGTVNMDETTMGISDKVLDRAFTLEFWDVDVDRWPGWAGSPLRDRDKAAVRTILGRLTAALSPARLHFGWRVIEEVVRFMEQRQLQSASLSTEDALDRALYAKVLPKLRGDDAPRVRSALDGCRAALAERDLRRSTAKVEELIGDLEQIGSFRFWR